MIEILSKHARVDLSTLAERQSKEGHVTFGDWCGELRVHGHRSHQTFKLAFRHSHGQVFGQASLDLAGSTLPDRSLGQLGALLVEG